MFGSARMHLGRIACDRLRVRSHRFDGNVFVAFGPIDAEVCCPVQARAYHTRDERSHRLRRWTHQFSYGGHYLTKSRRYSTTFTKLRQARREWHLQRRRAARAREAERRITKLAHTEPVEHVQGDDHTDSAADPERFVLAVQWRLDGMGWRTIGDALLAQTARKQALNGRDEARAQRAAERALEPWID